MAHLDISHLSVTYEQNTSREVRALIDINLSINRGEIVFLFGPNGSGKTTLFRALIGECACKGRLKLADKWLEHMQTHKRAKLISYWPQHVESVLPDSLTLMEVFSLGSRRMHRKRLAFVPHNVRNKAQSLVDEVGLPLEGKLDGLVTRLSGGQMSAALFLIAFGGDCELILLDEPTAALDEDRRTKLEDYIVQTARAKGHTLLWVTHDLNRAMEAADRIIILDQGRISTNIQSDSKSWHASTIRKMLRWEI